MIVNTNVDYKEPKIEIVTWGGGDETQVTKMLDAHYAGKISIGEYWSIGDTRDIDMAYIRSTPVTLVIIGIEHDDIENDGGKAAISVQTSDCVSGGVMNSTAQGYAYSLWSTSERRTWCNGTFKDALPEYIQNLIKPITKITNRHGYRSGAPYRGQTTTIDYVFLLSEFEVAGSAGVDTSDSSYGDVGEDGVQYEYMKTASNRFRSTNGTKYYGSGGYRYTDLWWLRSSALHDKNNSFFIFVDGSGTITCTSANQPEGLAPAFCL